MGKLTDIRLIAFDCFGTLVRNDASEWQQTLSDIADKQGLNVDRHEFWKQWSIQEVHFRKTRTNMGDPPSSPAFKTYWEAWRTAFVDTFEIMRLDGDPESAATYSVDALCDQEAFPEAHSAVAALATRSDLAVLSNADDRFLRGTLAYNDWSFKLVESSESLRAYKPDPRIFSRFLEQAVVEPASVLYVGDSPYDDAHGAKLAGMPTVLIQRDQNTPGRTPPPDTGKLLQPDFTVESLSELLELFE